MWRKYADRAGEFRRRHRLGQRLKGRLLSWAGPGLAWVLIDGQELLARVGGGAEPGRELRFQVRRLEPEIVLRETSETMAAATPAELARAWWSDRGRLESLAGGGVGQFRAAAAGGEALDAWLRLMARQSEINAMLAENGGGRFCYAPWLCPEARGVEVYVQGGEPGRKTDQGQGEGVMELFCDAEFDLLGRVLARVLARGNVFRFRLMLERPELGPAVEKAVLLRAARMPGLDAACLGHGPLGRLGRGVLGAMLDPAMGNLFTGVNVLV